MAKPVKEPKNEKDLSRSKMMADGQLSEFQKKIRSKRNKILEIQNKKKSLTREKSNKANGIFTARELFRNEIISQFPEYASKDLFAEMKNLPSNNAIWIRWMKYQPEIQKIENEIARIEAAEASLETSETQYSADLATDLAEYQSFYNEYGSLGVEAPQAFFTTLQAETILPQSEADSLLATAEDVETANALAIVNQDAQVVVTEASVQTSAGETVNPADANKSKLLKYALIGGGLLLLFS